MLEKDLTIRIVGNSVNYYYQDKLYMSMSLSVVRAMANNHFAARDAHAKMRVETPVGESNLDEIEDKTVIDNEVLKFMDTYRQLIYKYTQQYRNYGLTSKWYKDFALAVKASKALKVDFEKYIEFLIIKYSEMNKGSKVTVPFPRQLHGEFAEQLLLELDVNVNGKIPPLVKVKKLARANSKIPLEKDEHYQQIRSKIKARTYTKYDIEYIKIRHIQIYGEPKDWVKKYEEGIKAQTS
jgi:hypothetical protein